MRSESTDVLSSMRTVARKVIDGLQGGAGVVAAVPGVTEVIRLWSIRNDSFARLSMYIPALRPFKFKIAGKEFKYWPSRDDGVGRVLCWRGSQAYEPESLEPFMDVARSARTVLDIGANTGLYSMAAAAANPDCKIYAFEPSPFVHSLLRRNITMNGLDAAVVTKNMAVLNRCEFVTLHVPDGNTASATLDPRGFQGLAGKKVQVPGISLDSFVEGEGIQHVDLMKIDVEGFELTVLEGARSLLARDRPTVYCEVLPASDTQALEALLGPLGYRYYHLCAGGEVLKDHIVPDPTETFKNYQFSARKHHEAAKGQF